jgi:hypothetical protein
MVYSDLFFMRLSRSHESGYRFGELNQLIWVFLSFLIGILLKFHHLTYSLL